MNPADFEEELKKMVSVHGKFRDFLDEIDLNR
jgi:hypothetical protein